MEKRGERDRGEAKGNTSEEILASTALRFNQLVLEADRVFYDEEDLNRATDLLNERAVIVLVLADRIRQLPKQKNSFSEETMSILDSLSEEAMRAMIESGKEDGDINNLRMLLADEGVRVKGANKLDNLIDKLGIKRVNREENRSVLPLALQFFGYPRIPKSQSLH